jgi:IS5 family transposase
MRAIPDTGIARHRRKSSTHDASDGASIVQSEVERVGRADHHRQLRRGRCRLRNRSPDVPDGSRLAPAIARAITATGVVPDAVTADRGYGQTSVDTELAELGVELVAILRKGQPGKARQQTEAADSFVELVKWRTGAEGRISALKRQHGWGRARLRGLEGARTWCGWGILSHNAIKIAALSN